MLRRKGQASSIYTYIGVFLVAVFALFLFVTQSGNQAQNLKTLSTSEISYRSQLQLRGLFTQSFPVRKHDNLKIVTAISYACEYGKPSKDYAFTLSKKRGIRIKTTTFLNSYLNTTLDGNYRLFVECNENPSRNFSVGKDLPQNPDLVVSNSLEFPLAHGNRSEILLQRW